ncbi:hypothetical protein ACA097_11295 [Pseudomonas sp. QL9]|uniref:Uncharacterized protein n=1 Tax=Pseudomonas knackmussii (strain DSM 6978 / CCUG 54928 / LMG 23759 / B13) TaxID=1301098 RepID=A0A024H9R9_PSEKB|nr:hypothetical protein [Pseudomonas knackmussii]CDF81650.1 hypothetical protein PKB_0271 [Pseudomonas knackmussii B13]
MNDDDIDLPEPEHDHLLDHEFHDLPETGEDDATGLLDDLEETVEEEGEEDAALDDWDEDDSDAHWHDD